MSDHRLRSRTTLPALALFLASVAPCQTYTINTFAGGVLPENVSATSVGLSYIGGSAVDASGNVYLSLQDYGYVVRRDAATGILTRVAGNGTSGYGGDNGPAVSAALYGPAGLALDSAGNLYIADQYNNRVRKVSNGTITTVAGGGASLGDNASASRAQLWNPAEVAVDAAGNLFIADLGHYRVRKVSGGVISTVAGDGTSGSSGDNGPATSAQLAPAALALDSAGNLYVADSWGNTVRKVSNGIITTVAGGGFSQADNGPATSAFINGLLGVAVDTAGNLFIASSGHNRIRKVSNGIITTVAGTGESGFSGDNGPAVSARLGMPYGVIVDSAGNLFIRDYGNYRVRKVSNGIITTIAGNGTRGSGGDNGPATSAQMMATGVTVDSVGSVYISDRDHRVRQVSNGTIVPVAGGGASLGDGGPATSAQLADPMGMAVDLSGNLYIADYQQRIRKVSNGVITTVAGGGASLGDNGLATNARLNYPAAVAVDSAGNLYIADTFNFRIRKVTNGIITTVAGNGTQGFSGDNGPATSAQLDYCYGVAVDAAGNVYIMDTYNHRIRKVSNGTITTVVGGGTSWADNVPATSVQLGNPFGLALDAAGNLYFADFNAIRKVTNGIITTIAGSLSSGSSGDNGPAANALLSAPRGIALDSAGNVYFSDSGGVRVRVLRPGFFVNQVPLSNNVYYLQFPSTTPFGYFSYLPSGWIYHIDLGYECVLPGPDGNSVYMWDLSSGHWLYTSRSNFPYLYDFTLQAWLFYFPDSNNSGRYLSNPRYFANMTTGRTFIM